MSRPHRTLTTLSFALLFAACHSDQQALGRVPMSLIEMYDRVAPDGAIEIELERDGRVRELEAEIGLDELPSEIAAVALAEFPGGRMTGAERELRLDGAAWEVQLTVDGRACEVVIDESGQVRETERELAQSEAPEAVRSAALAAIPGGVPVSVERIDRPDAVEFHVKLEREGARYKVVLDESGGVLRRVREARAEIEVPLAD